MKLDRKIVKLLRAADTPPLAPGQILRALDLRNNQINPLRRELRRLERKGGIVRRRGNRFTVPRDDLHLTGTVRFRQSGRALLIPDAKGSENKSPQLTIRAEDTGVSMHGDRVLARVIPPNSRPGRYRMDRSGRATRTSPGGSERAEVVSVLERARRTVTGTLKRSRLYHFVVPDDPRIVIDILVPDPSKSGIVPSPTVGAKVVVRLAQWKDRHLNPEGEITAVLGKTNEPTAESRALLHRYNLKADFPKSVLKEVARLPRRVNPTDLGDRLDLRDAFTFTIDPIEAKDFDDAVSVEVGHAGETTVGVHIADVSAYVKPGTAIDRQAQRRGNSTYLVGQVIPMLPHALSDGICSLVEGEDRLTKSVFLKFAADGRIRSTRFANTVIRSRKRLTYEQAAGLLRQSDLKAIRKLPNPPAHQTGFTGRALRTLSDAELMELKRKLEALWKTAEKLRRDRLGRGALDLDSPEVSIRLDRAGFVERIERTVHDESHQLIEEYMLAANEAVARALRDSQLPFIHRAHDPPDSDRLSDLGEYMRHYNIRIGDLSQRKEMSRLLKIIKGHPQRTVLTIEFLRSMQKACYRAQRDGHFGLCKQDYAHFTSPIRRYSDLIVHRIFDRFLIASNNPSASEKPPRNYPVSELSQVAQHLSIKEQNSTEAERESVKLRLIEYFEREARKRKKTFFDAIIVEIRGHGFFVELSQSSAYGFVHVGDLPSDLYRINSGATTLEGRRQSFTMGQLIKVAVKRVDRPKRQIDFVCPGKRS